MLLLDREAPNRAKITQNEHAGRSFSLIVVNIPRLCFILVPFWHSPATSNLDSSSCKHAEASAG